MRKAGTPYGKPKATDLGQIALRRAKPLATRLTAQPLEGHFQPSKTGQQDSALRSLRLRLLASTLRAGLLVLFTLANGLLSASFIASLPACWIWLSMSLRLALASSSILSDTVAYMRCSSLCLVQFFYTGATSFSFFNPQPPIVSGTLIAIPSCRDVDDERYGDLHERPLLFFRFLFTVAASRLVFNPRFLLEPLFYRHLEIRGGGDRLEGKF